MSWFKSAITAIIAAAVAITAVAMLSNTSGQLNDKLMLSLETVKNLSDKTILAQVQSMGETISSNGGKTTFKVNENPTTGYQWLVNENSCPGQILKIDSALQPPTPTRGPDGTMTPVAPGTSSTRYFTLIGQNVGKCVLQLAYARSWEFSWDDEKISNNAEMITIPVNVQGIEDSMLPHEKLMAALAKDLSDKTILAQVQSIGETLRSNGGKTTFKVNENPTTGYKWLVNENSCPDQILKIVSVLEPPSSAKGLDGVVKPPPRGAASTRYFTLIGQNVGKCVLQLAYAKSWEFSWENEQKLSNAAQMIQIPVIISP